MPTESTIIDRLQVINTETALNSQAIENLEKNEVLQWEVIEKIKESLTSIKVQLAAFGVTNTVLIGWIAYKLTKGIP